MRESALTIGLFVFFTALIYAFTEADLSLAVVSTLVFLGIAKLATSVIDILCAVLLWAFFELQKNKDNDQ
jgi:hypothetical protein